MVKEIIIGMGLVGISTLLGAIGALLFKISSTRITFNFVSLFRNVPIYFGIFLYGISALLFVYALRFGDLSSLYPIAGLSYVWVSLLSVFFLGERMNGYKWAGIASIMTAVVFIGIGA
ncbi:EamA family transporter [Candidatus Woesearchaeota archaeon]|nr:EamA family transporter [Candidatus Woesearchaeota archaeon]